MNREGQIVRLAILAVAVVLLAFVGIMLVGCAKKAGLQEQSQSPAYEKMKMRGGAPQPQGQKPANPAPGVGPKIGPGVPPPPQTPATQP